VLVPDLPVRLGCQQTRLRVLARDGLVVLTAANTNLQALQAAFAGFTPRLTVLAMADIDRSGRLSSALDARPGEAWVIRPDAYVAAVVDASDVDALRTALRRSIGAAAVSTID
jgi:pentachlorophenol monooxygenase/3-(3-hydroxy-phenyl)propionate hydroxylase